MFDPLGIHARFTQTAEEAEAQKLKLKAIVADLTTKLRCNNSQSYLIDLLFEEASPSDLKNVILKLNSKLYDESRAGNSEQVLREDSPAQDTTSCNTEECVATSEECSNCEEPCYDSSDCDGVNEDPPPTC